MQTVAQPQRKRRFKREPVEFFQLQERDIEIIQLVQKHRFLTSAHIRALVEGSDQKILRRLQLLYHGEYLDRPREQITPHRAGSEAMIYGLGNKGADLLAQTFNVPRYKVDWTSKNRTVKGVYLRHTLLVAHFMVCLELACRKQPGVKLIEPEEIIDRVSARRPKKENPFGWKVETKRVFYGETRKITFSMVPDKLFGLYFPDEPPGRNKAYFFLEADRATMPIKSANLYKGSFYKKMIGYWSSWQEEVFKKMFGFQNARVLTITTSPERIGNMITACKEVDERRKGSKLFLFAEANDFTLENPAAALGKVWRDGKDSQLASLID